MKYIAFILFVATCVCAQEPGITPWTPKRVAGLTETTVQVPQKFANQIGFSQSEKLRIPEGYSASVFFAGSTLRKPRFMAWGPDSVLYVANMNGGNILALPDTNEDGIADTAIVAASGFSVGHDVRFYRDTMFVAQTSGIVKLWRSEGSGMKFDQRVTVVNKSAQANQSGGNHITRTLGLDTNNMILYLSVGSRGNADRELNRALVEKYTWTGENRTTVASGIRNAVGLTIHPRTGALWANNNGSDNQGNNTPGEWVDIIREQGFYGYPFGYHYRRYFDITSSDYRDLAPLTTIDSALMSTMLPAAAIVEAHSAPMAMMFAGNQVTNEYKNTLFMVLRGSWNRSPASGAKVVVLRFDNDADTIANSVEDFCTGFISDTMNTETRWGRPVGIEISANGSIFISVDDGKQSILKLTPNPSSDVNDNSNNELGLRCYPNPSSEQICMEWEGLPSELTVLNQLGEQVYKQELATSGVVVPLPYFPPGAYTAIIHTSIPKRSVFTVVR